MTVAKTPMSAIRFGYGFHPLQKHASGPEELLDQLSDASTDPPTLAPTTIDERRRSVGQLAKLRRSNASQQAIRDGRRELRRRAMQDGAVQLLNKALSPHGFFERLSSFWTDHFTVGAKNAAQAVFVPDYEQAAIRPYVTGRFADLLVSAIQHPAMLTYLDQVASVGPNSVLGKRTGKGLNENLARELLELHTLGAGANYSQTDVRNAAHLLTGFGVNRKTLSFKFFPQRAARGQFRVLDRTYGGPPTPRHATQMLNEIANHPATAAHISRKLAVHFVSDNPSISLVKAIERAWRQTDGDLKSVYRAMVEHPLAWTEFGLKAKKPQDLLISTLRAMGLTAEHVEEMGTRGKIRILAALRDLNQPLYRPPGPNGWPEEAEAWITPQGLTARLDFASAVGQVLAKRTQIDPRRFAESALRDALAPSTAFAVGAAPERWEGLAYTIASPEFNRR